MELHENLYELGLSFGRDVFDDADGLRAALDDFLDEGAASTGDINLLVDAVRLGSFQWMLTTIDSGAEPSRAIESAGDLLARDRGSADVAGSRWAVAVLGFAVGKVADTDVRRYRTQGAVPPTQSQAPPPTSPVPPTMSPTGPPPPAPPAMPSAIPPQRPPFGIATPPTQFPQQQSVPQPVPQWSSPPPPGQPGPPKKSKGLLPLLIGAGIGLVILAVVFGVLQLTGGDDEPLVGPAGPTSGQTSDGPTDGPSDGPSDVVTEGPDLAFDAINQRYTSLGTRVTTGQSDCAEGAALSGQTEAIACTFPRGTLELTTYDTIDELRAARSRAVNTDVGGRFAEGSFGVIFSFDTESTTPTLYWDNEAALQSGLYKGGTADVEVDELAAVYGSVESFLDYPTRISNSELFDFAQFWLRPNQCDRIQTLSPGEIEESQCKARRQITVYVAKMATKKDLIDYRQTRLRDSRRDGLILSPPDWMFGSGAVEGRVADSYAEGDRILRYWDQTACLCYMEAYYPTNDQDALIAWWESPKQ
ncbi:hypothetical protein NPS01_31450 [Nocardioides psychrotolerans]|uniref:Uncharacterized protein n=1 Tax=Nocardioides psychrotolerans TaxID=1005945 RepID=A0A1I3MFD7_9ACTN|nr:hypothetical protein [Nocardioides psychrotolerans]GEP39482.1 hypothetical protein NPS01_31450 [Nocardioides psychrotolerans]SFI95641.1 hypothetical protein SAMN05216561_11575 [Nocardioides psychrotolerans]